jgi:hypothetical protein
LDFLKAVRLEIAQDMAAGRYLMESAEATALTIYNQTGLVQGLDLILMLETSLKQNQTLET